MNTGEKKIGTGIRFVGKMLVVLMLVLSMTAGIGVFHPLQTQAKIAAGAKTGKAAKKKGKWKTKNLFWFYVKNGKRVKGLQKISGKTYYFDTKGIQRTGWRLLDGKYRYFRIRNGKAGYMLKNKRVNGISLNKKGIAIVSTETEKKLELLVRFQKLADTIVRPGVAKHERLVKVFKYARDKDYRSIGSPAPEGHWDERLAEAFLNANWADCTMAATGFAYLANAVGYTKVSVRLYGHGHCEINRLIYDPGFAKTVGDDEYTRYFAKTYQELEAWYTSDDTPTRFI